MSHLGKAPEFCDYRPALDVRVYAKALGLRVRVYAYGTVPGGRGRGSG